MYSPITLTGAGTAPVVNLTFPFLDKAHVKATVNGVAAAFTWTGASQITFSAAVAVGAAVVVYRDTPISTPLVDFEDTSVLTAADLDLADTQLRYHQEEVDKRVESASSSAANASAALTSQNAAAASATDAANSASAAAGSASAASTSASGASSSATTATTKASEANTSAAAATTKASEASASAATASTKASEASTSAANAATSATSAANSASSASASAASLTTERIIDDVAAALAAGTHTNVTVTYNDPAGSISLAASGGGAGVTDGDKGDVVISGSGTVYKVESLSPAGGAVAVPARVDITQPVGSRGLTINQGAQTNLPAITITNPGPGNNGIAFDPLSINIGSSGRPSISSYAAGMDFGSSFRNDGGSSINTFSFGASDRSTDTTIHILHSGNTTGKFIAGRDAGGVERFSVSNSGAAVFASVTVDDEVYGVSWNGSLSAPTKNAIYDKIETLSAGGVTDGDKGDITVTGGGTVWTLDANVVSDAKFRQSGGLSVVGRATNTSGNVSDIIASIDGHVLRRSGTAVGFGTIVTAGYADNSVTYAKMQDVSATNRVLGRVSVGAGDPEELTMAQLGAMLVPQVQAVASSATVTPDFANDAVNITAQAVGLTLANWSGTAANFWGIVVRLKDNGTARSIAYGTNYQAADGVTLPTTTVVGKTHELAFVHNTTTGKHILVSAVTY